MSGSPAVRGAQDTVTTLLLLRRDGASLMPAAATHHLPSFAPSRRHWPATIFRLHGFGRRCYTSETLSYLTRLLYLLSSSFLFHSTIDTINTRDYTSISRYQKIILQCAPPNDGSRNRVHKVASMPDGGKFTAQGLHLSNGLQEGRENDAFNNTKSQLQNLREHFCKIIFALDPVIIPVSQPISFSSEQNRVFIFTLQLSTKSLYDFSFSLHTDFTRKKLVHLLSSFFFLPIRYIKSNQIILSSIRTLGRRLSSPGKKERRLPNQLQQTSN